MPIRLKLIIVLLMISLLPVGIVGTMGFINAKKALKETSISGLKIIAEFKESEVILFVDQLRSTAIDFASDGYIRAGLEKMASNKLTLSGDLNKHLLKNKLPLNNYLLGIDVINMDGLVVASTEAERLGLNMANKSLFIKGMKSAYLTDIRSQKKGGLEVSVSTSIKSLHDSSIPVGLLVNHYNADVINSLLIGDLVLELGARTQLRGLGETGETYLVNKDRLMITDSKFIKDARFSVVVDSYPVEVGFNKDEEVNGEWIDYRGIPVIAASMVINLGDTKWVLISEQDAEEAFFEINALKKVSLVMTLGFFLLIVLVALYLARAITLPILLLKKSAEEVSSGRLDTKVDGINNRDEIGFLASAFNEMTGKLLETRSALEGKNRELEILSVKDSMTGLYNHRRTKELLHYEFDKAARYDTPLCCLLIDVDHFKIVNDTYGHLFGDHVLKEISTIMSAHARKTDSLGRLGGEEFFMILPNTSIEEGVSVAEKTRKSIEDHNFSYEGQSCKVTVSIGVSEYFDHMTDIKELIMNADGAMYKAKYSGRNCCYLEDVISNN